MRLLQNHKLSPAITIRDIAVESGSDSTVYSCNIGSTEQEILWYELPSDATVDTELAYYSFTLAAIAIGMQKGTNVHVDSAMDSRFIHNVREFIDIWSAWCPDIFSPIRLTVSVEQNIPPCPARRKAVMCFSGGVDGCATLKANIDDPAFGARYPVKAGILIQGFDVPLTSSERFAWLTSSCESILESVDIPLYTVRTNWRKLIPNWRYTHGLALASCLWLFSEEFDCGIIASGDDSYNNLVHGSNPFTDRLLSGEIFEIASHGGSMTRVEKIESIYQWPSAMENLNVCWANRKGLGNCGVCEKCVRTKLYFYLLDEDPPKSIPARSIGSEISSLQNLDDLRLRIWKTIIELAKKKGQTQEEWFFAASDKIKKSENKSVIKRYLRKLKSREK
ncbi:MAG: hypothetical protein COB82_01745 [Marinobacter sp.]|nr:MAG: hypothetical protein COB82_01745 [Marinobacter sp.]